MNLHSVEQLLARDVRRLRYLRIVLFVLLITAAAAVVRVPLLSRFGDRADAAQASPESRNAPTPSRPTQTDVPGGEGSTLPRSDGDKTLASATPTGDNHAGVDDRSREKSVDPAGDATSAADWLSVLKRVVVLPPADETLPGDARTNDHLPAGADEPATMPSPGPGAAGLMLHNPQRNGVSVNFLVGDVVHSLAPGEWQELPSTSVQEVVFDGGGDFGDRRLLVRSGVFVFHVSAQRGWELLKQ